MKLDEAIEKAEECLRINPTKTMRNILTAMQGAKERIAELEKVVGTVLAARSAWRTLEDATEAGTDDECIDCHTKSMVADAALETAIEELAAKEASDEK